MSRLSLPPSSLVLALPGGGKPQTALHWHEWSHFSLRCFKELPEFSANEDQAASPFPTGPRGTLTARSLCWVQPAAPGAADPRWEGRGGEGGVGGGHDRSTEPSRGSQELGVSDGLCFCFFSQLGTRQGAESSRWTLPPGRRHGQVLSRCSGGWLEAPSPDVLLFQGLVTRFTCLFTLLLCGVFAAPSPG